MGNFWSRVFPTTKDYKIIVSGMDSAGKSTLLYKLKLGKVETTVPSIGMVVETVENKNITFTSFEVGGRSKSRPLLKYFVKDSDAVVFVVDSRDVEWLEQATDELHQLMSVEELVHCPVVVLANKQDLEKAASVDTIVHLMDLHSLKQPWAIFPTQITTSMDGVYEAFYWLGNHFKLRAIQSNVLDPLKETETDLKESVTKTTKTVTEFLKIPPGKMKRFIWSG